MREILSPQTIAAVGAKLLCQAVQEQAKHIYYSQQHLGSQIERAAKFKFSDGSTVSVIYTTEERE